MFDILEKINQRPGRFEYYTADELWRDEHTSKEKVVLDKYTIVEAGRTRTVYNWLQYYALADLEKEFSATGFTVAGHYADVAGAPYDPGGAEFAVVARKS